MKNFTYSRHGGAFDAFAHEQKWNVVKTFEDYKADLPMREMQDQIPMDYEAGQAFVKWLSQKAKLKHTKELLYGNRSYFFCLYQMESPRIVFSVTSMEWQSEEEEEEQAKWQPTLELFCREEPEAIEFLKEVREKLRKDAFEYEPEGDLHVLGRSGDSFDLININNYSEPIIRENYSPENIAKFDYISQIIDDGEKNAGKLMILSGPPGTGKSYFCRGLISSLKARSIVFPVSMLSALNNPALITFFAEEMDPELPFFLIIEDGDDCLVKREKGNSYISDILNLGDGLIGESLNMYILVTTNKDKLDIDDAIVRPGRLLEFLEFNKLETKQANAIYNRESGDEPTDFFTEPQYLTSIYTKAAKRKTDLIKKKTRNSIGF